MVNRGASRGCVTCKKRRVKCDGSKPWCKECIRLGHRCAGYVTQGKQIRFKDETARYLNGPTNNTANHESAYVRESDKSDKRKCTYRHSSRSRAHVTVPQSPRCIQQDMAFVFFIKYVTSVGRSSESTRGFLEFICPVLAAESHDSALHAAVNATASRLWAEMRPSSVADPSPIHLHTRALMRLQQAINNPSEQRKPGTVFAALMLQYHATMTAVFDHHKAPSTHREGALALLTRNSHDMADSARYRGHLLANYLHSKVSACIRRQVPLTQGECDWIQTEVIPALPDNLSTSLDIAGMAVSRLQDTLIRSVSARRVSESGALQELPGLVVDVEMQLRAWLDAVPNLWRPKRIRGRGLSLSSVDTYHGSYDIYPSIQIANIWNTWRIYRLIVKCAHMSFTDMTTSILFGEDYSLHAHQMAFDSTGAQHMRAIQSLVDAVCRSIPFYLGNCHQPMSFADIDSAQLVFPSYHDLPSEDEAFINYKRSDHYVDQMDHHRHSILHGPLHALGVLSRLMDLLSGKLYSTSAQGLPQGQMQWIDEQFQRCLYLTRFSSTMSNCTDRSDEPKYPERVRQALWTVTTL